MDREIGVKQNLKQRFSKFYLITSTAINLELHIRCTTLLSPFFDRWLQRQVLVEIGRSKMSHSKLGHLSTERQHRISDFAFAS